MSDIRASSFWTEGPARLLEGLESRRAEIEELFERWHNSPSPEDKAEIEATLRTLFEEYDPYDEEIEQALFFLR